MVACGVLIMLTCRLFLSCVLVLQVRVHLRNVQEGLPDFKAAWDAWVEAESLPVSNTCHYFARCLAQAKCHCLSASPAQCNACFISSIRAQNTLPCWGHATPRMRMQVREMCFLLSPSYQHAVICVVVLMRYALVSVVRCLLLQLLTILQGSGPWSDADIVLEADAYINPALN